MLNLSKVPFFSHLFNTYAPIKDIILYTSLYFTLQYEHLCKTCYNCKSVIIKQQTNGKDIFSNFGLRLKQNQTDNEFPFYGLL